MKISTYTKLLSPLARQQKIDIEIIRNCSRTNYLQRKKVKIRTRIRRKIKTRIRTQAMKYKKRSKNAK